MKTIKITHEKSEFIVNLELLNSDCEHENIELEKACCVGANIECACYGHDEVVCLNPNCTGIDDNIVPILFERLAGGGSDCE